MCDMAVTVGDKTYCDYYDYATFECKNVKNCPEDKYDDEDYCEGDDND